MYRGKRCCGEAEWGCYAKDAESPGGIEASVDLVRNGKASVM